jgi:diguanylate cyclase (GGDEF)-like protein
MTNESNSSVNFTWGRMMALLSKITAPVTELAPTLLGFIGVDLGVDRLGLYVTRRSGDAAEFVLAGVHSGFKGDTKQLGEIASITYDPEGGLIQEIPTPGVGWDMIMIITPMNHNGDKLVNDDILAILAIDDTSTARKFTKEKMLLIQMIHWAMREFFTQREIIAAFRDRDPKTGLLNTKALADRVVEITEIRSRNKRKTDQPQKLYSVAFIDLDKFRDINTAYGEPFGDEVLKSFAKMLKDYFRPYDVVVRFGGEEFVVIIDELGEILKKRLEGFLEKAQDCEVSQGGIKHFGIPFSAGVVDIEPDESVDDAIKRAAALKKEAKDSGRATIMIT